MSEQFWLTFFILVFGVSCLAVVYLVMRLKGEKSGWGEYSTRLLILILVGTLGAALVFSPVSAEKTGQVLSLFGVIAGYVLGSWGKKG